MADENYEETIDAILKSITFGPGRVNGSSYMLSQRHLAKIYFLQKEDKKAIYHLTESHGAGLRQVGLFVKARSQISSKYIGAGLKTECLAFNGGDYDTLLNKLKEMPAEWTIVQITREFNPWESLTIRKPGSTPKLESFHITRLPCGSGLQSGIPVSHTLMWPPNSQNDLIQAFIKIKKQLGTKTGSSSRTRTLRQSASAEVESYCREIAPLCIKEWICLFLGQLVDSVLESEIRLRINHVLQESKSMTKRQKYLTYLLAESCFHLTEVEIRRMVHYLYKSETHLRPPLIDTILNIKKNLSSAGVAKRHPVILVIDEHLDLVPWESLPALRKHPVSRAPSLHFIHALYHEHKEFIVNGLREIPENEVSYYVVNPGGDLPSVEENLSEFMKKRLPHWVGIIGQKPTEDEFINALTKSNTFLYCGHGSGCQYLPCETILSLKVKPVQLLFGCSSSALKDYGGNVEMSGDILQFTVAGSVCSLGMLWPVTSQDTDNMTISLANTWLPGNPVFPQNIKGVNSKVPKERELLRALKHVRESAGLFSNSAALIARGLPIKLVPTKQ